VLTVLFALLAALANATASVLQRRAAREMPDRDEFSPRLVFDLLQQPVWLCGVLSVIVGFLLQATALGSGAVAEVQSLLVAEIPFTLAVAPPLLHVRLHLREGVAAAILSAGLGLLLVCADPRPGARQPGQLSWVLAGVAVLALIGGLTVLGRRSQHELRAALLAAAAGSGFGFTAAVMQSAVHVLTSHGVAAMFTSWHLYATVAMGVLSFLLLQNAFQAGKLVAAQPAVTISDPVVGTIVGVMLFGDTIRLGWWAVGELAAVGLLVAGTVIVAGSPLVQGK
jgi:drug/metabolite transporter (DMT)-like permease